jgi:hypothetical protein
MSRVLALVAVVTVLAVLFGCSSPGAGGKKIQIVNTGWVLENLDTSYWTDGFNSATCFGWFDIVYTGDAISMSDIQYARAHLSGSSLYWDFPIDSSHVDLSRGHISSYHNYTTALSLNGSIFPIGLMEFEVALTNGNKATYSVDVPVPGQTSSNGKGYVYTPEDTGGLPNLYTPMLKRPICTAQSKAASISLTFHSADPILFNGYVILYDATHVEVGVSPYFRNSNVLSAFVNGGAQLYIDGTDNNVTLQPGDITYRTGKTYSDIREYIVVLTDGSQYPTAVHSFDCVAFGPRTSF